MSRSVCPRSRHKRCTATRHSRSSRIALGIAGAWSFESVLPELNVGRARHSDCLKTHFPSSSPARVHFVKEREKNWLQQEF